MDCEPDLHLCNTHDAEPDEPCPTCGRQYEVAALFTCTVCKDTGTTSTTGLSLTHPVVVAFFWKRGIRYNSLDMETASSLWDVSTKAEQEVTIVSEDPPRVREIFRYEGDEVHLTYDEALNVVEVTEED